MENAVLHPGPDFESEKNGRSNVFNGFFPPHSDKKNMQLKKYNHCFDIYIPDIIF